MNKQKVLSLNVVPEGKEAWLSYDEYLELKRLFEATPIPAEADTTDNSPYFQLYRFLTTQAGLDLPFDETAIHSNAFTLIRRGYQVETITSREYKNLCQLLAGLEEPTPDDTDLYDTGGHRALYDYLTQQMGLSVQTGRGPAWHRARNLIKKYEAENLIEI